jgi:hypothetical protein
MGFVAHAETEPVATRLEAWQGRIDVIPLAMEGRPEKRDFSARLLLGPPASIAAAHHISVRYLHKLFEAERVTVAESVVTSVTSGAEPPR